jgi:hypothetical protein
MPRLVTLLLLAAPLLAQSDSGRITGRVVDPSGAVIPGAQIRATNERTGITRLAEADEGGSYTFTNLAPASYTIVGEGPDLGPTRFGGIQVAAGQERTLDLMLHPSSVVQEVTISSGELVVIDTSSARIGANVNEREVARLPLNGRQLSQLYLLAPGAQTAGGGSFDNIRFSGRANQQNAVRFDGVEGSAIIDASPGNLNGESSSGFRLQASLETIQEFRVESSNYPAEFGTGTGGQIGVVTKSGGNEFHGALFHYLRNSAMDARNFFDLEGKSPLRLNQFGGSLGGPILRHRMFFFAAYEGLRQRAGLNFIETVPGAQARSRAVPSIRPLLNAFPLGDQTTDNPDLDLAHLNASSKMDEDYGSLRLDYRINDKFNLSARYFRDQGYSTTPLGVTGNSFQVSVVPQNAMVSLQHIVNPTAIHETKFGLNAYKTRAFGYAPPVPGVDMSAISVDFTGNVALAGIGGQGAAAGAARPGGLVRSNSTQNGRGQPYTNYSVSWIDTLSWIKGDHNLKFGLEVRPVRLYTDRLGGTTYTFSNLDDLLANQPLQIQFLGDLSAPSPFNGGATGQRQARQTYYVGYAQDEWKLRPTLTMSYGLRYEYYSVLRETRNLAVVFDTVNGGLLPSDTPFYQSARTNFGPRLAFSWAPSKLRNKSVFRVGAGYYFGPGQTEDLIQPIESDRVSRALRGVPFPIAPADLLAGYDINNPNLGFQPRAYTPGYRLPERVLSYTASWQQELAGNAVLTVAYVGSQGRNLFLRSWTNLLLGAGTHPVTGVAIPQLQFGNRFGQIDTKTSGGTDHYDSLQTSIQRRFKHGLTVGSQWTWGHSIGNTGGSNEAQTATNPYDFSMDRGNNAFDVRHTANATALYELPFGRDRKYLPSLSGPAEAILGGWEVGGTFNSRTGLPIDLKVTRPDVVYFDPRTGAYLTSPVVAGGAPVTTAVVNVPGGGAFRNVRRPDVVAGVNPYLKGGDKRFYLNPAAFAMPAPGTFGNLARGALHGPSLAQFDLALHKRFQVSERFNLHFRSEIYNLFNRANFANPPALLNNALGVGENRRQPGQTFDTASAGGNFGVINSTVDRTVGLGTSRQIQLSLRLEF